MLEVPDDVHAADRAEAAAKDRERRVALAEAKELQRQAALKRRQAAEKARKLREDDAAAEAGWSEAAEAAEAARAADDEEADKAASAKEELELLRQSGHVEITIFTYAAYGDVDMVCKELDAYEHGPSMLVNQVDSWDMTLLHHAAEFGSVELCKQLLTRNAKIDRQNKNGWTPLAFACNSGHHGVVAYLLKRGANSMFRGFDDHRMAIHRAIPNDSSQVVAAFINHGPSQVSIIDDPDEDNVGMTLLMVASRAGAMATVQVLIQSKLCDVEMEDWDDLTALDHARSIEGSARDDLVALLTGWEEVSDGAARWSHRKNAISGKMEWVKVLVSGTQRSASNQDEEEDEDED